MEKICKYTVFALLFFTSLSAHAQQYKYWIFFQDKGDLSGYKQIDFLSKEALAKRKAKQIPIDFRDYPVSVEYKQTLTDAGIEICQQSRWLNGVSAYLTSDQLAEIKNFGFVKATKPVVRYLDDKRQINEVNASQKTTFEAGYTQTQLGMIGLDTLHANNLNGAGITIAVLDNGFREANLMQSFSHLFTQNRIIATKDFVNPGGSVYDAGDHGCWVLSILAGYQKGTYVGSAPGANYILCRTEDDSREVHEEEDNWVAGAEFADSVGADIFTTSLGYSTGMGDTVIINGDTIGNYEYSHMDGNTAIITVAADIAASRGILVLNSAGNAGNSSWEFITAPADGDSVLTVGSVDEDKTYSSFSSRGPTTDGRLKPELVAMGGATYYLRQDDQVYRGSGTSFSCPLMAGLAACLLQSKPSLGNMELFDYLVRSGHQYANPDYRLGHGIPSGPTAYQLIHGVPPGYIVPDSSILKENVAVYPNPSTENFFIVIENEGDPYDAIIELFDLSGRKIMTRDERIDFYYQQIEINKASDLGGIPEGIYVLRIRRADSKVVLYNSKLVIQR